MVNKLKIDEIPGEWEKRVFIGGNYDFLATLRQIADFVREYDFEPIIAYDFDVPNIHDGDLRLLHNCKYAIFAVSISAGELMELERCKDYGTKTLVVYQARERDTIPNQVSSMILTTGFTKAGYVDFPSLKDCVSKFLHEEYGLFKRYLEVYGYKFRQLEASIKVNEDKTSNQTSDFQGLEVVNPDLTLTQEGPHHFELLKGRFTNRPEFTTTNRDKVTWHEYTRLGTDSYCKGDVVFMNGLRKRDGVVNYRFEFDSSDDICFTKEDFDETYPNDDFPYEYFALAVRSPIETLKIEVSFFSGYKVNLQPIAFQGKKRQADAVTGPSVTFNREDNRATLIVKRPKIFYDYLIYWEPILREEYEELI